MQPTGTHHRSVAGLPGLAWSGPTASLVFDEAGQAARLLDLARPCYAVRVDGQLGLTSVGELCPDRSGQALVGLALPLLADQLGDPGFRATYGTRLAYAAGAMANGIASEELVIALGRAGLLGSFGAAGLTPDRVLAAIQRVQAALPDGPYAFNLIHSPHEAAVEERLVELYLARGVRVVEASAFLRLTPAVVRYRVAGLAADPAGQPRIVNRLIAKVSRREVARQFLEPPPESLVQALVEAGHLTAEQAALAARVPMADDVTVEADSAGHTDNRPLVCLLPSIVELRDELQRQHRFAAPVRIGAAGGISTPLAALAAFAMGAAYVVTGSINQACVEAGASAHARQLLAQADFADVVMAPAADMFELGVRVQVLKRGTMFGMRAQRLYEVYRAYDSVEAIPAEERAKLEAQLFRQSLDEVWADTRRFFLERDPRQVARAEESPKRKLALICRWYLGQSSRWSNAGEPSRELDYQIWCGPAMGAFNDWARGSFLEEPANRRVVDVARNLMTGAAYLARLQQLATQGVSLPSGLRSFKPRRDLLG